MRATTTTPRWKLSCDTFTCAYSDLLKPGDAIFVDLIRERRFNGSQVGPVAVAG
jgi:hypothetical protein